MITRKSIFAIIVIIAVAFVSCEKEKIEYEKQYSGDSFYGFSLNNNFIIHDESISYYNADSNKVSGNLFEHQNGRKLGNSVHSLKFFRNWKDDYGIITVEGENMIEIVDKNFISVKQIPLYKPRNISIAWNSQDEFILISYGDAEHGGIAVFAPWDLSIIDSVRTGNTAGEIYVHNYIYVSSNGDNDADTTIAKIYYGDGPFSLQKVDDIVVGKGPVKNFETWHSIDGYYNRSLFIYCKGDEAEAPKIVLFDMIQDKVLGPYNLGSLANIPDQVLDIYSDGEIYYNSNNSVYSVTLDDLASPKLLTRRNIMSLADVYLNESPVKDPKINHYCNGCGDYYLGISAEENGEQQYLYRFYGQFFEDDFFELIDSIPIGPNAKEIVVGWP